MVPRTVSDLASIRIMRTKDLLVDLFHIIGQMTGINPPNPPCATAFAIDSSVVLIFILFSPYLMR